MFNSIRRGLFAALAGFTVFICVGYTGVALVIAYVTEDMLIDRLLARRAALITAHARLAAPDALPVDSLIEVFRSADALPPIVRAQVAAGHERAEIFAGSGQHYHLRTLDLLAATGTQRIYLLADVQPILVVSALFREVGGLLIMMALGLLALSLLLAYLLSRRLVAPLQVLADEIRTLAPAVPVELSASRRPDEIGYLARKLSATIGDLHASLEREHAFTRDMGHELRTPLTVMKNTLSQAAARPLAPYEVAQLRSGLAEIGATVDVLFSLARAEHVASHQLDLRACIEDCMLRMLERGAWDLERWSLHLPDRLAVVGNPHLTSLLIKNCLDNANFHGGPASRLEVAFTGGVLSFSNTVDPGAMRSTQGFLHGLQLLRRIADAMTWGISFHATPATYRVDIAPLLPN